jgi:hypothetical protein
MVNGKWRKNSPHPPQKKGERGKFQEMTIRRSSSDAGLRGGGEVKNIDLCKSLWDKGLRVL